MSKDRNCYDWQYLHSKYGAEICDYCENPKREKEYNCYEEIEYYCEKKNRDYKYCRCAYENMLKEKGEYEKMTDNKNVLGLNISLDGIIESVKSEVKAELKEEIKTQVVYEFKKEIFNNENKPIMPNYMYGKYDKEDKENNDNNQIYFDEIRRYATDEIKKHLDDYIQNNMLTIGGGWNEEPKQVPMTTFLKEEIKKVIEGNTLKIEGKQYTFNDYIVENAITSEIRHYMNTHLKDIQKNVEKTVKKAFDDDLSRIINEVAFKSMKATADYKTLTDKLKITSND